METPRYSIASAADSRDIIQLIAKVFSESEPPAVAVGLTTADMENFLGNIVPRILSHGLTITARDDKEELAGALLTEDLALSPDFNPSLVSRRFTPIMAMLKELDSKYLWGQTVRPRDYLHLLMLAVDPRLSGYGIAQALVANCLKNGAPKGYRTAVTEATGNVSQHVFRKQGFVERIRVSYQDFRCDGKAPFASILEHHGAVLMDKKLGAP